MICSNDEDIVAKTHNEMYGELRDNVLIDSVIAEYQITPITTRNQYDTIETKFKIYLDQPMNFYTPDDIYHSRPYKASKITVSVSFYRYELSNYIQDIHEGKEHLLTKIKNIIGLQMRQAGFEAPFNMDDVKFAVEYILRK